MPVLPPYLLRESCRNISTAFLSPKDLSCGIQEDIPPVCNKVWSNYFHATFFNNLLVTLCLGIPLSWQPYFRQIATHQFAHLSVDTAEIVEVKVDKKMVKIDLI